MQYRDENRGVIQFRGRAKQSNSFKNLRFGKITPTDIDGFIDFHNNVFIFIEVKYKNSPLQGGQMMALERLCDATDKAGIYSILIIARHETTDVNKDVDVGLLTVSQYWRRGIWRVPEKAITVHEAVDRIYQEKIR